MPNKVFALGSMKQKVQQTSVTKIAQVVHALKGMRLHHRKEMGRSTGLPDRGRATYPKNCRSNTVGCYVCLGSNHYLDNDPRCFTIEFESAWQYRI